MFYYAGTSWDQVYNVVLLEHITGTDEKAEIIPHRAGARNVDTRVDSLIKVTQ